MFVKLIFSVLLIFAHKLSVLISEITRSNANIDSDSDLQYLHTLQNNCYGMLHKIYIYIGYSSFKIQKQNS